MTVQKSLKTWKSLLNLLLAMSILFSTVALAQTEYGPGFPNVSQTPGQLLAGPLAPTQGRTAVIAYHQGFVVTNPESPGSAPGSDLLSRVWDISDPSNPIATVLPNQGPNAIIAAHGYWQEGNRLRGLPGFDYTAVDPENDGTYVLQGSVAWGNSFYYPQSNTVNIPWTSRGLLFQPFQTQMWWSYGSTNHPAVLYKREQQIAVWDHIAQTGVIGHPFLLGNILYLASDQSNTGIAAYDISPSLNNPGTPPQLLGTLNASIGGYWPEIWGSRDRLLIMFPARENGRFYVADVTDPRNMQVVADRQLGNGGDPSYIQFQDNFAFMDRYKINMQNDFSVALTLDAAGEGIDVSQFALPLGNLVLTGGYPHPNLSQGMAIWAHQATPDNQGPEVGFHIPQNNQTNFPVAAPISLLIHETLRSETIVNGETFILRATNGPTAGSAVSGMLTYAFNDILTFTPDQNLLANTTYEVVIPANGIRDAVGNGISPYSFTFSTGSVLGSSNQAPIIESFSANAYPAPINSPITLNVEASDPESSALEYKFSFGDGSADSSWQSAASISHTYTARGHYSSSVQVRDAQGATAFKRLTVTVGSAPQGPLPSQNSSIAHNESTGTTYVVNPDSDTLALISGDELVSEAPLPEDCHPRNVAFNGNTNEVWLTCSGTDEIIILNASGELTTSISLPYGSRPWGLCFLPNQASALISLKGKGTLRRYNASNHSLQAELTLGPTPFAIAVTGDSNRALVSRFISPEQRGEVWDVSLASNTLTLSRTIALALDTTSTDTTSSGRGLPNYLSSIAIHPSNNRAWIASKLDNIKRGLQKSGLDLSQENTVRAVISEIDLSSNAEVFDARRDIDNSDSPSSIRFSPLGDYAFVTLQGNNTVAVYDAWKAAEEQAGIKPVLARFAVGAAPQGSTFNIAAQELLVQNFLGRSLSKLRLSAFLIGSSFNATTSELSSTNNDRLTPQVLRGKKIFYNASDGAGPAGRNRMSGEGYISCATCHFDGGHDGRTWDFTGRGEGLRNTTDLRGRRGTGHGLVHWSANFDEIQDFENDIRNAFGGSGFMSDNDFAATANPLGTSKLGRSADLDALAAYVSSLGPESLPRSPYRNTNGTMTESATSGEAIFTRENCNSCHGGASFTDSSAAPAILHNVGSMSTSSGLRLGETLSGIDTPTLLGIHHSAPYLHDGAASSLNSVFSYSGSRVYPAEDAQLQGSAGTTTAVYGGSYYDGMIVGFGGSTGGIVFSGVDGGANGGAATVSVRYAALYAYQEAYLNVNGVQHYLFLPRTNNNPGWWPSDFAEVSITVNLNAGTNNQIEILPVARYGQIQMGFDEIRVSNSAQRDLADAHVRISELNSSEQSSLIDYLLQLDGSNDTSLPPDPTPTPSYTPQPTPTPDEPDASPTPDTSPLPDTPLEEDLCPNDANKTQPLVCGCNTPDSDLNGNNQIDCNEVPGRPRIRRNTKGHVRLIAAKTSNISQYHFLLERGVRQRRLSSATNKSSWFKLRTGNWKISSQLEFSNGVLSNQSPATRTKKAPN